MQLSTNLDHPFGGNHPRINRRSFLENKICYLTCFFISVSFFAIYVIVSSYLLESNRIVIASTSQCLSDSKRFLSGCYNLPPLNLSVI